MWWYTTKHMSCPICTETYTLSLRKRVVCSSCHETCCMSCAKRYILSTMQDAHCLFCFHVFSDATMRETFNKTWVHSHYKHHRENILVQREKQLLPQAQPLVRNFRIAETCRHNIEENTDRLNQLRSECERLRSQIWRDQSTLARLERTGYRDTRAEEDREKKNVVQFGCPVADCRGFVEDGVCGTCEVKVCMGCGEPTAEDDHHQCNPDTKKGFQYTIRNSKRCPKCFTNISKTDGCNQMFCVVCKTAFMYDTLEICTSAIHNPHYFQYLRDLEVEVPRMDEEDFCNNTPIPDSRQFAYYVQRYANTHNFIFYRDYLFSFTRNLLHIYDISVTRMRRRLQATDHTDLRLHFLMNNITEEEWKTELQRREKKSNKNQSCVEIYEMACVVGGGYLWQFCRNDLSLSDLFQQVKQLQKYTNDNLESLEQKYNMVVERFI